MVIIYILAVIGGICVLGVIGMVIMFVATAPLADESAEDEPEITCTLTNERCIYTVQRETCNGCPVLEEAEKIGDR